MKAMKGKERQLFVGSTLHNNEIHLNCRQVIALNSVGCRGRVVMRYVPRPPSTARPKTEKQEHEP